MDEKKFNDIYFLEIETLSPVHVGSGNRLKRDFEYLEFPAATKNDPKIAVVTDMEKVLDLLGEQRIPQWLSVINRGESTLNLLKQVKSGLKPTEVGSRLIEITFDDRKMEEFKEMILNGNGEPYVPGSSLKGAFRTALLAEGLRKQGKDVWKLGVKGWSDKVNRFFGKDMNTELMRFLSPSDATFSKTECVAIDILNRYHDGWDCKKERDPVFLEVIPPGEIAYSRIAFPNVLFKELAVPRNHGIDFQKAPKWNQVLRTTHEHNLRLLRKEIDFWQKEKLPAIVGAYVEYLERILEKALHFDPEKEALMRLGFASGWKSITGEWQEDCMSAADFQELMDRLHHTPFAYPKTRKLAFCEEPLGYLKIRHCATDQRFVARPSRVPRPDSDRGRDSKLPPLVSIATPLGPKYQPAPIKKNVDLEAEYCPQPKDQGAMKSFKLFLIEPGQEQIVAVRYPADLPVGRRVKVRITDMDVRTGVVRSIEFRGLL